MNEEKIRLARENFLRRYPGGFSDPAMGEISRKHKPEKMYSLAREILNPDSFERPEGILPEISRFIGLASVVSVFEKVRFRDFMKNSTADERIMLSDAFFELLHGDREKGFLMFDVLLTPFQLNKWTLVTVLPAYYYPEGEVFIKPTTVKQAIDYFEMENLLYRSKPDYRFYAAYRENILVLKRKVALTDDNLALGGFIMIAAR